MRVEPRDGSERPADSRPNAALPRSLKGNKTSDFLMKESSSASMHDDRRQEFLLAALPMKVWQILPNLIGVGFLSCAMVSPQEAIDRTRTSTATHDGASNSFVMQPGIPVKREEPCVEAQIGPNAAPPTWDSPASTTQCGTLETDSSLIEEAVGAGVLQQTLATTAKYGLTSHLEVRWGLPGKIAKGGGGTPRLQGTTDQWIGACYRFHDEGRWTPDLALDFAIKFPTANPAKGFGSGYVDDQLTFIASRDWGATHIDFNLAGTIAGSSKGKDGAAEFGLALTRQATARFLWTLEVYGGPQPGTDERYGSALVGGAWSLRPWLSINSGYARAFTAGMPHEQFLLTVIYTSRPWFASLISGSRFGRALGR